MVKPVNKILCVLCQEDNKLDNCFSFLSKPLEEQGKCVQKKKLCYGCLKSGHSAKECRCCLICNVCDRKHPTSLHDESFVKMVKTLSSAFQTQSDPIDATNTMALSVTGEERDTYTSMIVPVGVSTKQNPSSQKLVYALLDSQSDTTFIDKGVCDAVQARMERILFCKVKEHQDFKSEHTTLGTILIYHLHTPKSAYLLIVATFLLVKLLQNGIILQPLWTRYLHCKTLLF